MAPKPWVQQILKRKFRDALRGRRALYVRYKPYRKERCWGVQVIMPE